MEKNLSTQLSKPPELQPLPVPPPSKAWRIISFMLTFGGLGLIGWGGWLFIQQEIEARRPPPARILEVSVEDLVTETPLPSPIPSIIAKGAGQTPVPTEPAGTASSQNVRLSDTLVSSEPATNLAAPDLAYGGEQRSVPFEPPSEVFPFEAAVESTSLEPALEAESGLSLADNPLLVAEEAPLPTVEPAAPGPGPAAEYETGLSLTRIVADSIDLDSEVIEVGWTQVTQNGLLANVWIVADYAAGWHKNSQLPGQGGNVVLSAHHNIKGEVFRYIVDLEPGDIVTLYNSERTYEYRIEDKFIVKDKGEPEAVRRANAKWIGPFNEERLTLITCWPYNNNTHRVIVIGKPVS